MHLSALNLKRRCNLVVFHVIGLFLMFSAFFRTVESCRDRKKIYKYSVGTSSYLFEEII